MATDSHRPYPTLLRRLRGASGYLVSAQVLRVLLNYATVGIMVRHLSLSDLGIYFMLTEVGRIGSIFAQAGSAQSAKKFIGQEIYRAPLLVSQIYKRMTFLLLMTTAITVGACVFLWGVITSYFTAPHGLANLVYFACGMILVTTFNNYQSAVLLSIDRMAKSVLALGLIQKGLFLAALSFIVFGSALKLSITVVLIAWMGAGCFAVTLSEYFVFSEMRALRSVHLPTRPHDSVLPGYRELLFTTLPMGVASGMATLRNSADVLIAGSVLGPAAAGIYGPCRMVANLVVFVLQAITSVLPAVIAAAWRTLPLQEVEAVCRKAANYGALVAVPAGLVLIFMAGFVLNLGFGAKLAGHGDLLRVLVLGPMLSALFGASGAVLQVTGYHKAQMVVTFGVTALSLAMMPIVAGKFGIVAMGSFSSFMLVVQNALLCFIAYKFLHIRTYVAFKRKLLTAL